MTLHLLTLTLSTSTPVSGDCIVYFHHCPKLVAGSKPKLIYATGQTLAGIYAQCAQYNSVVLHGIDMLLPLKLASVPQIVNTVRGLSQDKQLTVILNSDDTLRTGEHASLLQSLAHTAHRITNLRALPSGRDREYAGMARFSAGAFFSNASKEEIKQGERLFRYGEDMMSATL